MITVMAVILILFTLALIVLHFLTNAENKSVQRIREQILRLISPNTKMEFLRGQVYEIIDGNAERVTLRGVHGIRTQRGIQVLEMISRVVEGKQKGILLQAINEDWFSRCLYKKLTGKNRDAALISTKLIAQLGAKGYIGEIEDNLMRWPERADVQEICLLAMFMQGQEYRLAVVFSEPWFNLVLSFRTLQELISCFPDDRSGLYSSLLKYAPDKYVKRACIRGIGIDGYSDMCKLLVPYLSAEDQNIKLEAIRTLGRLGYTPVSDRIAALTRHERWEVRCAAVDAIAAIDRQNCYDTVFSCVCDSEWWVRFHAAEILVALPCRERLLADIEASDDRYAREIVRYMIERESILKKGSIA